MLRRRVISLLFLALALLGCSSSKQATAHQEVRQEKDQQDKRDEGVTLEVTWWGSPPPQEVQLPSLSETPRLDRPRAVRAEEIGATTPSPPQEARGGVKIERRQYHEQTAHHRTSDVQQTDESRQSGPATKSLLEQMTTLIHRLLLLLALVALLRLIRRKK
ncbi:MAG: hypothetical protein Q4D93_02990 [Porphyromonas sp.]|nr:hypothetical protein [Porphyromonas sp.]